MPKLVAYIISLLDSNVSSTSFDVEGNYILFPELYLPEIWEQTGEKAAIYKQPYTQVFVTGGISNS